MPTQPTERMRRMQARWMADTVRLFTEQESADVDPATGQPTITEVGMRQTLALVREQSATRIPGEGRVFGERILEIKVPEEALPQTGDRLLIVMCPGDSTLSGKYGTVQAVERDSIRVVRRLTVKMDSDV